ncbi:uncharacterized protein PRCAT00004725001 [Priceomyces carsonii]|uniref:uncharacterized protein n=1 Tax=Priceomyces carsonii TaxID=28549 RepID=UPI002ED7903C|nr:unnamed protein product [Priceomyces carsonii]
MEPESNTIKVLVRVRPRLQRESDSSIDDPLESECLVRMPPYDPTATILEVPPNSSHHSRSHRSQSDDSGDQHKEYKQYRFDEAIWSYNKHDANYTDNKLFYDKCGPEIVEHIFQGFNVCLLAYGQTSSGKTYTMMGNKQEPGFIPQIMHDVLKHREILIDDRINCELKLTYIEVYNEQVKDLFGTEEGGKKCKVREHPVTGPYVENLKEYTIESYQEFERLLNLGNTKRSTASTSMNEHSSRSHAILTLTLKQTRFTDGESNNTISIGDAEEVMISSIKLVDLAGSERLEKTKTFGQHERMKEGTLINKSLTVLGRCINLLAKASSNPSEKSPVIPYRDSILTYIMKENLAGNSKTFMIFCISPLDFDETYQTLNYANQVKKIKTMAKANKTKLASIPIDWNAMKEADHDVIRNLKDEIESLTAKLHDVSVSPQFESEKNVSNILAFLQSDLDRVKFENRYLKQKLFQKSAEADELTSHIKYMDHEYRELSGELSKATQKAFTSILEQCVNNASSLDNDLFELDPKRLF